MAQRIGIVGASIAGLLAARVLAEQGSEVILFERDVVPTGPILRKSVPQAAHPHVLLARGAQLLGGWFPDLFSALQEQGAVSGDMSAGSNWFHFGTWKRRLDCGVRVHFQSRLLLEHEIRRRVLALPRVYLRHATVQRVTFADDVPRVWLDGGESQAFDLLVDASGRGTRLGSWLVEGGYDIPREEKVVVDVCYTSARFFPTKERDYQGLLIYPKPPHERRAGGLLPVEGGQAVVSCFGWCGQSADPTPEGMLAYAKTLPQPEIASFLESARRISDVHFYRYKEARRWRTDEPIRFPERVCVMGDALCSVDPVFGQGMTLACLQADLLAQLARESGPDLVKVARRFRAVAMRSTETAWMLSTSEDYRYPEVLGKRPFGVGFSHWYTEKIHLLTARDEHVYRCFARVMNLLEEPTSLFRPSVVAKVLQASVLPPQTVAERPRSKDS